MSGGQKVAVGIVLVVIAYVVLSGPVGGFIYWGAERDYEHLFFYLNAYHWHLKIYAPLAWVASRVGLIDGLMEYWQFCGWRALMRA